MPNNTKTYKFTDAEMDVIAKLCIDAINLNRRADMSDYSPESQVLFNIKDRRSLESLEHSVKCRERDLAEARARLAEETKK